MELVSDVLTLDGVWRVLVWAGGLMGAESEESRRIPTGQLGDEQRKPDAHRRNEGRFRLLGRQHKYRDHELRCEEHLDEDTLGYGRAVCEGCEGAEGPGEDTQDDAACGYAGEQLGGD
jgi:hypothetical protein